MLLLAIVFIAIAVFLVSSSALASEGNATEQRLMSIAATARPVAAAEERTTVRDRLLRPMAGWLSGRAETLMPVRMSAHFEQRLEAAGNPVRLNVFLTTLALVPLAAATLAVWLGLSAGASPAATLLVAVAVGGYATFVPTMWLKSRATRRQKSIARDLPDALDLLVVAVEAGLGLEPAMGRVAEGTEGPLAAEFRRALAEMSLGVRRRKALQDLSARTGVSAVSSLVAAILQADQTGIGVGQVLRVQAEQLRVERRQRAEEQAMKAPLKMLFPLVLFIFPALFVVILAPAMITFLDSMSAS